MFLKPVRYIPDDTKIPFMRFSRFGFFLSGVFCTLSLILFIVLGLNFGVDFKGGMLMEIRTPQAADLGQLRERINGLELGDAELQEFGAPTDILIRLPSQPGGEEAQQAAVNKVSGVLGTGVEIRRVEVVGPKVSGELTQQGIIAVSMSIVLVLIYIWFRFEWQFSLGAVASLLHDVILTIGLFSIARIEFNLSTIAAILLIIGYSLNDTVVVFDRIRENLRRYKQMPLAELIESSINSTLSRTIMTSMTTMLVLLALFIFGGEVIRGFSFTMLWGVVIGTYSSIFIASPVLILLGSVREAVRAEAEPQKAQS
jgi:preprotein translocase subunit SecF